jgi:hypothetical protein
MVNETYLVRLVWGMVILQIYQRWKGVLLLKEKVEYLDWSRFLLQLKGSLFPLSLVRGLAVLLGRYTVRYPIDAFLIAILRATLLLVRGKRLSRCG